MHRFKDNDMDNNMESNMKKTYLKNGSTAIRRFVSVILCTVGTVLIPSLEFFEGVFPDMKLYVTALATATGLSWIMILTLRNQGLPFFVEISDEGITEKWFNKPIKATKWEEIEAIEEIGTTSGEIIYLKIHPLDSSKKPIFIASSKRIKEHIRTACPQKHKYRVYSPHSLG